MKKRMLKLDNIFIVLLVLIISAISVVMIYYAILIDTKLFSSNEINETTKVLKIVGFVVLLIGLGIIYLILH